MTNTLKDLPYKQENGCEESWRIRQERKGSDSKSSLKLFKNRMFLESNIQALVDLYLSMCQK